jgi:hypothetical protein
MKDQALMEREQRQAAGAERAQAIVSHWRGEKSGRGLRKRAMTMNQFRQWPRNGAPRVSRAPNTRV